MQDRLDTSPSAPSPVFIDPVVWRVLFIVLAVLFTAYVNIKAMASGHPLYGIVAIVGIALLVWGISNPRLILYWVLIYYPLAPVLTSIQPRGAQVGTFTLLLLGAIVVMQGALKVRAPRRLTALDWLVIIHFVSLLLGYRSEYGKDVWLWGFKQEGRYLVMFFLLRFLDLSHKDLKRVLHIVLISAAVIGGYGIIQYFFDYGRLLPLVRMHNFLQAYGGEHENVYAVRRAYSILLSPLNLGYTMMMGCMLCVCLACSLSPQRLYERRALWIISGLCVGALVLSFTRSAWGGFGVGMLLLFFLFPSTRKPIFALGLLGLAALPVIYLVYPETVRDFWLRFTSLFVEDTRATAFHYLYLKYSWLFVLEHPLGVGLGTATFSAKAFFANHLWTESEILNKGVQCGWLGLASFVAVLVAVVTKAWKIYRTSPSEELRGISMYLFAGTFAGVTAGMTGLVWVSWVNASWFWMVAAITFTLYDQQAQWRGVEKEEANSPGTGEQGGPAPPTARIRPF